MASRPSAIDVTDSLALSALRHAPVAVLLSDGDGRILFANHAAERLFGYSEAELLDQPVERLVPEAERAGHAGLRAQFGGAPRAHRAMGQGRDLSAQRKDGSVFPVEIGLSTFGEPPGRHTLVSLIDISERRRDQEALRLSNEELRLAKFELEEISLIDPLTKVFNRQGIDRALFRELNRPQRTGSQLVAVLIDLDDFERLNRGLGYAVGDRILEALARQFRSILRPIDYVARVGGDEFLILLPDTRMAEARTVAERLRIAAASLVMPIGGEAHTLTVSMGLADVPVLLSSSEELLRVARGALERSKAAGKNRVFADKYDALRADPRERTSEHVLTDLLRGLGILAFAQSIVTVASGEVVGHELLSRCEVAGFESPYDFFLLAREANALAPVDLQCLRSSVRAAVALPGQGDVHVNLFPSTLLATPSEQLLQLLAPARDAHRVCVELSEQQFVGDPSFLAPPVMALRKAGIEIAIDDVGFGRSSLETLIVLEPDVVKIDRRYVDGCSQHPEQRRALSRLTGVVRTLGSRAVAEGIEQQADLEVVRDLGIELAQGYLWARPWRLTP